MKILLAVDGSAYSKKMLAYLATHDAMFSAANDYTVFTAQAALPARARAAVGKEVVDAYYADESEKVIAPVTKFLLRHGINAKSSWKVGSAGAMIAKLAEDGEVRHGGDGLPRPGRVGQFGDGLSGHPGAGTLQSAGSDGALARWPVRTSGRSGRQSRSTSPGQ